MTPKVLVVGDAMADHYWFAEATRLSAEAPIPVCRVVDVKEFPGGAANVEANLNVLGAETRLVCGSEGQGSPRGGWDEGEPIIPVKHRLMVGDTQVARWDLHDAVQPIDLELLDRAVLHWTPDAVVVSDYGKGSVDGNVIDWAIALKRPLFVDTKRTPVMFSDCSTGVIFFPNQTEYDRWELAYKGIITDQGNYAVVLKRGSNGIQLQIDGLVVEEYPAWADRVVSVCGAGDTVIAAYVYALTQGFSPLPFANAAAAVSVGKPWTSTATIEEIHEVLKKIETTTLA